ncbi:MAG: OmpA family protein [Phenylobacterium sp.]|uniref:OmpA family protein n=1 Tax=Phenylobacterium sp. TaxID=1871053 RepID=UPI002725C829|nr:OmpA family protein [Phenylobacterium sp.]MDO8411448.1 OmpA family protein [Phenylobacterium sp.]
MMMDRRGWGLRAAALGALLALGGCQTWLDRPLVEDTSCADVSAEIYFQPDSADLGPDAQRLINAAAEQAQGCTVTRVDVLGLADAPGTASANLTLSQARAEAVTAALAAARLPAAQFHVQAAGDAGAVTQDGLTRPMRRRVEIVLRLGTPG